VRVEVPLRQSGRAEGERFVRISPAEPRIQVGFISECLTRVMSDRATRAVRLEWPERFPVVGPLVGVGVALSGTITAATEGDGVAATVFGVLAVLFGAVAWRNARSCREHEDDRSPPADDGSRHRSTR
jgi:hypothetical protein